MPQRRVALYARYSTDMQSDRSVEDQHALCEGFALAQGLTVAARYSDRARSGATVQGREGLAALMADTPDGGYDVEVFGPLTPLLRRQRVHPWGRVVAEDRLIRSPKIAWGRWPVRKSAEIRHSSVASAD